MRILKSVVFLIKSSSNDIQQIHDGVTHAAKLYPNAYLIMIIIGTLKGNGAGFTKLLERLIRGAWTPTAMEFMQPTLYVLYNRANANRTLDLFYICSSFFSFLTMQSFPNCELYGPQLYESFGCRLHHLCFR